MNNCKFFAFFVKILSIALVIGLVLGVTAGTVAAAPGAGSQNTLSVSKAIQGNLTTVETGAEFTYLINYAYASTVEDGHNVQLVDYLDPDLSWSSSQVIIGTTPHIASTSYDATTGKVTWQFVEPLPAGSSGQLTLRVRFRLGSTLPNTVATNSATMTANNAPTAVSNEVAITATASCKWVANVTGPSSAVLDQNVTYTARLDRPNPATGNLNATGGTIALTLPVGVLPTDIVNTNGGVISGTGTAGDPVIVTWTGVTGNADGSAGSAAWSKNLVFRYDSTRFSQGQVVTVGENMTVTVLGGGSCSGTDSQNTTLTVFTPNPNGSAGKGATDSTVIIGTQTFYYTLDADSTGNVGLDNFTITDPLPQNFALGAVRLPTVNNGPGGNFITLTYRRSDTGTTEYAWPGSPFPALGTLLNVSDLGLPAGVYVSYLRFAFGSVAFNFSINNPIQLHGTLITPGWGDGAPPLRVGDKVCNTMTFTADYNGSPAFTKTASTCVTASEPTVRPDVAKSIVAGGSVIPGQTTTWLIEVRNPSSSDIPMVNPVGMDLLPAALEYVSGSFTPRTDGTYNSSGAPAPTLEVIPNYNGTGRTLLRWSYTHAFPVNTRATVQFQTRVKPGTASGSISNRGYVAVEPSLQSGPVVYVSPIPDTTDLDGDGNTTESIGQSGSVPITVNKSAALDSLKLVKGQLDTDWTKYPATGLTSPGGIADYRLIVQNSGNVPLTNIVIVDILPFVGDTGVVVTQPRGSQWTPFLAGPVSAPAGVTVYYSTEGNPQRDEMGDPDPFPPGSNPPGWSTVPPPDITTVRSLRFDFGRMVLAGGDQLELRWPMRAPVNAPTNGEVAWNSFGVVATRADTGSTLLPTEPIKVGIAVEPIRPAGYGNLVWNDLDADGIQDVGEPGLNGVRVELYRDNGDGVTDPAVDAFVGFTLSNFGGQYLFSNLPVGDYFAVFFKPPTYTASPADQGGNDEADSDGTAATVRGFPATITPVTTLSSGEIDLSWDQGFYQPTPAVAAVGNYVWFDENANGVQDEPAANGLNGVTVRLYTASGTLIGTTTTANDVNGNPGYYLFDGLSQGSYYLEFVPSSGFTLTAQGPTGSSDPEDSDPDPTTGRTETFVLSPGEYDPTWDAGLRLPTGPLSLGDRVWWDDNGNGIYEPGWGELGVDGVRLNLYRDLNGNGVLDPGVDQFFKTTTTFTKAGVPGYYEFTDLPAGDYLVQVDPWNFIAGNPLAGYTSTSGNGPAPDPDNNLDHDDNGEPMNGQGVVSRAITLTVGGEPTGEDGDANTNLTLDFGFVQPASLGDFVWNDLDADGIQDAGEPGLDGITVKLYRPGYGPDGLPGTADDADVVTTTVTAGGGLYHFTNLHPGEYAIEVVLPAGYQFSPQDQGGDDSLDSDVNPATGRTANHILLCGSSDLTLDVGLRAVQPDLAVDKRIYTPANRTTFIVGEQVSFQVLITNTGSSTIAYLPLADTFDNLCLTYSAKNAQPNESSFNNATGTITWLDLTLSNGQDLAPGATFTTTITFDVTGVSAGGFNTATVSGARDIFNTVIPDRSDAVSFLCADARIRLDPTTAVNEVGQSHTFTVTVEQNLGNGWVPVSGVHPVVTLAPTPASVTDHCAATGTDANGRCTVVINHNAPGLFTAHAAVDFAINGAPVHRETTGAAGNSPDASKRYVDARIRLDPAQATNPVGEAHTFTVTVEQNDGSGWVPVSGLHPVVTISPTPSSLTDHCAATGTNANGRCTVVINHNAAANFTANAAISLTVAGLNLSRSTAGNSGQGGSGPATKTYVASALGDFVWHDLDADGIQDANEPGLPQISVALFANGTCSGSPLATTSTDANGFYGFANLAPGTYSVRFAAPAGYSFSPANQGGDDTRDSDANPATGCAGPITLAPNQTDTSWDAGLYQQAALGDFVWNDLDADGIQDAGEPGLAQLSVALFANATCSGSPLATTSTDANGLYSFANLTPGTYSVHFTLATGAFFSPANQGGDDTRDSDANPVTGCTGPIALLSQTTDLSWDAGQYCQNPILGTVYQDTNQDGQQGPGEPGIPGVTLTLYRDNGDGLFDPNSDTLVTTTVTDNSGNYTFPPQAPGTYFVVEQQPQGYNSTTPDRILVQLTGACIGGSAGGNNFGEVFGAIGDFIFLDSNGNGIQDPTETQGVPNVPITLTNQDTGEVFHATSNTNGLYLVDHLVAGTYRVEVPAVLPGLVRTTSSPLIVVLAQGQTYLNADFGYIAPTGVTLVSFVGTRGPNGILLRWVTAAEHDQEGFRVWRATSAQGPYAPVSGVIPAANHPNGAAYEWLDTQVKAGLTYWYKLESLPDGQRFGPVSVGQEDGLRRVFIPLVRRQR